MASSPADAVADEENFESANLSLPNDKEGEVFNGEKPWVERHNFLLSQGYELRPRYKPGWKASWKGSVPGVTDEDGIPLTIPGGIMDARRTSDNTIVVMKNVEKTSSELRIMQMLSTPEMLADPRNHSVPLLDVVDDPLDNTKCLLVIPLLREVVDPPFASVGDCVDFVTQTLEALDFLHGHKVSHRDCFIGNIMMDARALYPKGWHPQHAARAPNGPLLTVIPKRQSVGGVRYYLIDFGISTVSQDEITGVRGQKRAPELDDSIPYNPYQVDIWLLGSCFQALLPDKFTNVDWILPLIEAMTKREPESRPSAKVCIEQFNTIKAKITAFARAQRLHTTKQEGKVAEAVRDTFYLLSEAIWSLKKPKKPPPPFKPSERPVDTPSAPE